MQQIGSLSPELSNWIFNNREPEISKKSLKFKDFFSENNQSQSKIFEKLTEIHQDKVSEIQNLYFTIIEKDNKDFPNNLLIDIFSQEALVKCGESFKQNKDKLVARWDSVPGRQVGDFFIFCSPHSYDLIVKNSTGLMSYEFTLTLVSDKINLVFEKKYSFPIPSPWNLKAFIEKQLSISLKRPIPFSLAEFCPSSVIYNLPSNLNADDVGEAWELPDTKNGDFLVMIRKDLGRHYYYLLAKGLYGLIKPQTDGSFVLTDRNRSLSFNHFSDLKEKIKFWDLSLENPVFPCFEMCLRQNRNDRLLQDKDIALSKNADPYLLWKQGDKWLVTIRTIDGPKLFCLKETKPKEYTLAPPSNDPIVFIGGFFNLKQNIHEWNFSLTGYDFPSIFPARACFSQKMDDSEFNQLLLNWAQFPQRVNGDYFIYCDHKSCWHLILFQDKKVISFEVEKASEGYYQLIYKNLKLPLCGFLSDVQIKIFPHGLNLKRAIPPSKLFFLSLNELLTTNAIKETEKLDNERYHHLVMRWVRAPQRMPGDYFFAKRDENYQLFFIDSNMHVKSCLLKPDVNKTFYLQSPHGFSAFVNTFSELSDLIKELELEASQGLNEHLSRLLHLPSNILNLECDDQDFDWKANKVMHKKKQFIVAQSPTTKEEVAIFWKGVFDEATLIIDLIDQNGNTTFPDQNNPLILSLGHTRIVVKLIETRQYIKRYLIEMGSSTKVITRIYYHLTSMTIKTLENLVPKITLNEHDKILLLSKPDQAVVVMAAALLKQKIDKSTSSIHQGNVTTKVNRIQQSLKKQIHGFIDNAEYDDLILRYAYKQVLDRPFKNQQPINKTWFDLINSSRAYFQNQKNFYLPMNVILNQKLRCPQATAVQARLENKIYYWHANWMGQINQQIKTPYTFIGCSFPRIADTIFFWKSVFDHTDLIIDLTTSEDRFQYKLTAYCPLDIGETLFIKHDNTLVSITLKDKKLNGKIIEHTCELAIQEGHQCVKKTITRIHYVAWKDGEIIPIDDLEKLILQLEQRLLQKGCHAQAFIHCYAGVNRTSTLIAATILREMILKENSSIHSENLAYKLVNLIFKLKIQRGELVLTHIDQFKFLMNYGEKLLLERNSSK